MSIDDSWNIFQHQDLITKYCFSKVTKYVCMSHLSFVILEAHNFEAWWIKGFISIQLFIEHLTSNNSKETFSFQLILVHPEEISFFTLKFSVEVVIQSLLSMVISHKLTKLMIILLRIKWHLTPKHHIWNYPLHHQEFKDFCTKNNFLIMVPGEFKSLFCWFQSLRSLKCFCWTRCFKVLGFYELFPFVLIQSFPSKFEQENLSLHFM